MMEDRFWLSARHQQDEENEAWEQLIARATIQALADSGAELASDEEREEAEYYRRPEVCLRKISLPPDPP